MSRQDPLPLHALLPLHVDVVPFVSTLPHVPFAPPVAAAEQAWHVPVQAVLQQNPLTQLPAVHWVDAVQTWPTLSVGTHCSFPLQKLPVAHWLSCVHDVRQAEPEQAYGEQDVLAPAVQVPVPLHVDAATALLPEQVAAAHCVPDAYIAHAVPPLLQSPVVPHVDATCAAHAASASTHCPPTQDSGVFEAHAIAPVAHAASGAASMMPLSGPASTVEPVSLVEPVSEPASPVDTSALESGPLVESSPMDESFTDESAPESSPGAAPPPPELLPQAVGASGKAHTATAARTLHPKLLRIAEG
jgi:hypothetical protein